MSAPAHVCVRVCMHAYMHVFVGVKVCACPQGGAK